MNQEVSFLNKPSMVDLLRPSSQFLLVARIFLGYFLIPP
jgi:hypothetical protein